MPLVSIIVTTFNRKQLLDETLQSILSQTFNDYEIIVVDNFSNYDFSGYVTSLNCPNITWYQYKNNGIIAKNRNYGLQFAKGKYIAFCDDDDIWHADKLAKQVELIQSVEDKCPMVLVHSNTILFGEGIKEKQTNKKNIESFNDFIRGNPLSYSSVMVTNSEHIIFNEDMNLRASEDFNLWVELCLKGYVFELIEEPLIRYRINQNSASAPNRELNALRFIYVIMMNILKYKVTGINYVRLFYKVNLQLLKFTIIRLKQKNR